MQTSQRYNNGEGQQRSKSKGSQRDVTNRDAPYDDSQRQKVGAKRQQSTKNNKDGRSGSKPNNANLSKRGKSGRGQDKRDDNVDDDSMEYNDQSSDVERGRQKQRDRSKGRKNKRDRSDSESMEDGSEEE